MIKWLYRGSEINEISDLPNNAYGFVYQTTHLPTNKKYCPCTDNKTLIRTYERVGYMEAEAHDQLVTKRCDVCNIEGLFKVDSAVCGSCKSYYRYNAE
jgi:hypothetical protein